MTRRVGVAIALVVAAQAGAAVAASAASAAAIEATPPLQPGFRASTPDYTVRCRSGEPVRLTVDPPEGPPSVRSVDLDPGQAATVVLGKRRYRIRCLPPDFPRWRTKRYSEPEAGWYLVTPNKTEGAGYAVIFDSHGVPVWWMRQTPAPFAASLLANGHVAWTNYAALSPVADRFVERTLGGRGVRSFGTVGTSTNQHDFELLPNGNALMLTYPSRDHVDLSRFGGPKDAVVLDGEIQEIDPAGNLVWSWRSNDHVTLEESARWLRRQIAHPTIYEYDGTPVYDLVHLNSIEPRGNRLIVSSRYMDAVFAIARSSGAVVWKLGGTRTAASLSLSGARIRSFGGQHDARLANGLLTVFDNGSARDRAPRAVAFKLDLEHRRASLVHSVRFAPADKSVCCGSARLLPSQHWVISWGNTPFVTEQGSHSQPVLTIEFRGKDLASYRAVPIMRDQMTRDRLARAMRNIYGG
ncbi:MAG: arylsulfotransferase family protein [Thermoleophilaceae bacterium]